MNILVTEALSPAGLDRLARFAAVDVRTGITAEQLLTVIGRYDALIVRNATRVTADVLEAGQRLKVVGRAGVGVDNIDVEAATARGILVVNVPDGNTLAAAEHTMGLILALARHIPAANASLKAGEWDRARFMGVELYGKTLGLIGLGRIGMEVARRAAGFGMRVLAYDPYLAPARAEQAGVELRSLGDLLPEADFLSIHAPLTPATRGLIGAAELATLKPGARVINCARGGIVDEAALAAALAAGKVAGAALDVFEQEPPDRRNPLLSDPRVIVTPHLGSATVEAQEYNAANIAEQVCLALAGQPVLGAVNMPRLTAEEWREVAPYQPLVELLGAFAAQALAGPAERVEIRYAGDAARLPLTPLTSGVLKGLLEGILTENVNLVNAAAVARRRGINVRESREGDAGDYRNLVSVAVSGAGGTAAVQGTVSAGGRCRVVGIDGYPVDLAPAGPMILTRHIDVPGIIGKVGSILGNARINIAAMQVGRRTAGGEAVMVLLIDEDVPDPILAEIARVERILAARRVRLPGPPGQVG